MVRFAHVCGFAFMIRFAHENGSLRSRLWLSVYYALAIFAPKVPLTQALLANFAALPPLTLALRVRIAAIEAVSTNFALRQTDGSYEVFYAGVLERLERKLITQSTHESLILR